MAKSAMWSSITFEPKTEKAYAAHMLERVVPLGRLGSIIGASAFGTCCSIPTLCPGPVPSAWPS